MTEALLTRTNYICFYGEILEKIIPELASNTEIDHEIFSTVILSLPLIQEGQLSVSGERMCTILVNRLEDLACPVNVWLGKLTALDMTPLGIFSTVILSLPLIQEGQLSVSGEKMCTILVHRLED